jgi:putative ABC transport system permease protein
MLKNYLKIAWRNIRKEKFFSFVKIGGFSIGIATCLMITLYIIDELSYDKFYTNTDRIYRVFFQVKYNGEVMKSTYFPLPFSDALKSDFPEIEKAGKLSTSGSFGAGKRSFKIDGQNQNSLEDGFVFANHELLEILEIQLLQGNIKETLLKPQTIIISQSKAQKYFPKGNALGKTIFLDNNTSNPYTITGVMKNIPKHSHIHFDFILPIEDTYGSWTNQNYFVYILVAKHSNVKNLEKKMFSMMKKYIIPAQKVRGRTPDFIDILKTVEYKLQPVSDIYLKSDVKMGDGLYHGNIDFTWLFAGIAFLILILASINFINLSTAKSANRAKEVGLRKTVGAFKKNLISQFLTETVLLSLFAFVIGVIIAQVTLPIFNNIASKSIEIPWNTWWFYPLIVILAIVIGIIAGLYPAFYLSSFKPIDIIKGSLSRGSKNSKLRNGLVIFQFTTSVILIIGTLVIYFQMHYILNKNIGYNKEHVLIIEGADALGNKTQSFKNQILEFPFAKNVSQSDYLPIEGTKRNINTFKKVNESGVNKGVSAEIWRIDYEYIKTLGIQLKDGRDFSKEIASDSINSIIINQKLAYELGLKYPLGKKIDNNYQNWKIIGVIKDFNFKSLRESITPLALVIGKDSGPILIKLHQNDINKSIASIASIWKENAPNLTFNYTFLDQDFAKMHSEVKRMEYIFNSFSLLAIIVACLGLFALSAFMVEQRKKEISIRIVLGASFKNIYKLLALDFLKLITISIFIAVPIGWYIMNRWLQDFAFRITIGWEIFFIAGMITLAIAILTISYQSIGAAITKPVKNLRDE